MMKASAASSFTRGSRRCRKPSRRAFSSEKTACSMLPVIPASVFSTKDGLLRLTAGGATAALVLMRFASQAAPSASASAPNWYRSRPMKPTIAKPAIAATW